jgi:hypothetical protein
MEPSHESWGRDIAARVQAIFDADDDLAPALPVMVDLLTRDCSKKTMFDACFAALTPSVEGAVAALVVCQALSLRSRSESEYFHSRFHSRFHSSFPNRGWHSCYLARRMMVADVYSPLLSRLLLLPYAVGCETDDLDEQDPECIPKLMWAAPVYCFMAALVTLRRNFSSAIHAATTEMARRVFGHSAWTLLRAAPSASALSPPPADETDMLVRAYQLLPLDAVAELLGNDDIYTADDSEVVIIALAQLWWHGNVGSASRIHDDNDIESAAMLRRCVRVSLLDGALRDSVLPRLPWWSLGSQGALENPSGGPRCEACGVASPLVWDAVDCSTHDFIVGPTPTCLYKGLVWSIVDDGATIAVQFPPVLQELLELTIDVCIDFTLSYIDKANGRVRIHKRWNRIVRLPGRAAIEPVNDATEYVVVGLGFTLTDSDFVMSRASRWKKCDGGRS